MNSKRIVRTGPQRSARTFKSSEGASRHLRSRRPSPLPPPPPRTAVPVAAAAGITDFYRPGRPAAVVRRSRGGRPTCSFSCSARAAIDGLDPGRYRVESLESALRSAQYRQPQGGPPRRQMLSQAFVDYVRDLRRPQRRHHLCRPRAQPDAPLGPRLLESAASAPSLEAYVDEMRWMNPIYGQLRRALADRRSVAGAAERGCASISSACAAFPPAKGRYVIVNTAAQRLFMYENGEAVDFDAVVVGKPKYPTPMMSAYIRSASLNPYWYVPPDLAAERIAPNVVKQGLSYLDARLSRSCRTGRPSDGDRSVHDRLAGGRRRPGRSPDPPAARAAQFDGPDQIHVPER